MLTIKATIKKDGLRVDRKYNVKLVFTYKRRVKRVSTSLFVGAEDLTKNGDFRKGTNIYRRIEALVEDCRERCYRLEVDRHDYSVEDIVRLMDMEIEGEKPIDFILFCREWIEHTTVKGKKNYQSALNAFISFMGKESLEIDKFTSKLLNDFIAYLNKKYDERALAFEKKGKRVPSNRSVSLYLGSLRHLFNEAKKKYNSYDYGIIRIPASPFDYIQVPRQQATRKRAISVEDVRKIWNLPYRCRIDNGELRRNRFNIAKDCFLLSFCLIGMNSVDLFNCTEYKDDTIIYNRTKTQGRRLDKARMEVKVPALLQPIFNKYRDATGRRVFKFYLLYHTEKNFNRAINYGLKDIGEKLGLFDLEFYAARHSWATIAINKLGIDKYIVHEALNHVDESMRVTDIYIQRDFVHENRANEKVVNYVLG